MQSMLSHQVYNSLLFKASMSDTLEVQPATIFL